MNAEEALVTRLLATQGVTNLVGTRIHPMTIPENAAMPAIAYQVIDGGFFNTLERAVALSRPRIQVNCWAETYASAKAVARAVKQSLNGYDTGDVAAQIIDERDLINPDSLHEGVAQDYWFWASDE